MLPVPISNVKNYHKFCDLSQTKNLLFYGLNVGNLKLVYKAVFLQETKAKNPFLCLF